MELENGEEILKKTGRVALGRDGQSSGPIILTNSRVVYGDKEIRLGRVDTAQIEYKSVGLVIPLSLGIPGLLASTLLVRGLPHPMEHPVFLAIGVFGLLLLFLSYHFFIGKTVLKINNAVIGIGNGKHKALIYIATEIIRIKKRGVGKPMRLL